MSQLYTEKYVKDTNSPWLVFLHGFGGSIKMWKRQVDQFKERYNLLFLDLPGHGKSRAGISGKMIEKFEDIADIVMDTLKENGIQKATFMCVSLGSLVFAALVTKYPNVVDSAILCGAISGMNGACQSLLGFVDKIKIGLPYMLVLTFFAYVLMPFESHKKSREFFVKSGKLLGKDEFIAWFSLFVKDMNVLKNLENIKTKILFIEGDEDFVFISGVKKKCKQVKEASLSVIKHCGHVCNIQKWKEFNDAALDYLDHMYFESSAIA